MGTSISVPQSQLRRIQRSKLNKLAKDKSSAPSEVAVQNKIQPIPKITASDPLTQIHQSKNSNSVSQIKTTHKTQKFKLAIPQIQKEVNQHVTIDPKSPSKNKSEFNNIQNSRAIPSTKQHFVDQKHQKYQEKTTETKKVKIASSQLLQSHETRMKNQRNLQISKKDQQNKLRLKKSQEEKDDRCSLFNNKVATVSKPKVGPSQQQFSYSPQQINFQQQDWDIPKEVANPTQKNKRILQPQTSVVLSHNFSETNSSGDLGQPKRKWKTRRQIMNEVIEGKRQTANDNFMLSNLCQSQPEHAFLYRNDKFPMTICNDR